MHQVLKGNIKGSQGVTSIPSNLPIGKPYGVAKAHRPRHGLLRVGTRSMPMIVFRPGYATASLVRQMKIVIGQGRIRFRFGLADNAIMVGVQGVE